MLFVKSSFLNKHELGATHVPAQINVAKYRNVRNKRISGVAAGPRADCDDDTLLIYRRVSKCRLWLRRTIPSFYLCLRRCVFHAEFRKEHVKLVDKDKIERLVGELPRYTKIVVLFKRISDECMIPKTDPAMLALQLLC